MVAMPLPKVAIIGAGFSGVATAAHLSKRGVDVTVFERNSEAGGAWLYSDETPPEPYYPSVNPSKGENYPASGEGETHRSSHLAPPGPCYVGLKNNVATRLLTTSLLKWPKNTPDYVSHQLVKQYIQDIAAHSGLHNRIQYNTFVARLEKHDTKWLVESQSVRKFGELEIGDSAQQNNYFDSVIVTSGHYHAPRVPDLKGLKEAKEAWPHRILHSKGYRSPHAYSGKNVLLIGAGTSSTDIAREIAPFATAIIQSSRNGLFDLPTSLLPDGAIRVGEIDKIEIFDTARTCSQNLQNEDPLPLNVRLKSGETVCGIHNILVCTGYHITLPFLKDFHRDDIAAMDADEEVLVTDGTQVHNLHKDIFYIPDPSLMFIGVPYYTATFSLFEFQAMAVAAVISGLASLPSEKAMRREYKTKLAKKGAGKTFHSLRGEEVEYVNDVLQWVNSQLINQGIAPLSSHSDAWLQAKAEQTEWIRKLFGEGTKVEEEVQRPLALAIPCQ